MSDRGKERGQMEKDKSWEIEKHKREEETEKHNREEEKEKHKRKKR